MPQAIVITGDIVDSTRLSPDRMEGVVAALQAGAALLSEWVEQDTRFTRHRGDGWQICLPPVIAPLRAALTMRAALRQADRQAQSRMALALGPVTLPATQDLNLAGGAGFVESGRLLDRMPKGALIADARGGAEGAVAELAHHISDRWTPAQARAVLPMLAPDRPTQEQVAEDSGITRQAVRQALVAAGFPALSTALDLLEAS
mgnify:CR=1 FL=1|jgi:DNA-binding phage protein